MSAAKRVKRARDEIRVDSKKRILSHKSFLDMLAQELVLRGRGDLVMPVDRSNSWHCYRSTYR